MIQTLVRRTIDPKFKMSEGGQVALYIQDGIAKLPSLFGVCNMDEGRIVDYIVYQVYRSRQAIVAGSWKHTWLFSQTAMERFKRQFLSADGKSGMNYYINCWLDEYELSRGKLTVMIAPPKLNPLRKMVYMESEEPIKMRFHNTEAGLALCQSSTTGWSPLSHACKTCKNWVDCGQMTVKKYPELMRFRKEEYGKQKER